MSTDPAATTSTMSTDSSNTVFFPPRQHADFVIHYDNAAFHVHTFVLHHHSAYFRAYFQTLSQLSASPLSSDDKQPCNHPHIAHCIHLPHQTELVCGGGVTAAEFREFLCHLYFSAHYCYPPFSPKTHVDLCADSPPLCITFPAITSLDWVGATSPMRSFVDKDGKTKLEYNESLLTLAHYFDCGAMTQQCEAVLLTMVEWAGKKQKSAWLRREGVHWLLYADRYKLARWKHACISVIAAADDSVLQEEWYKTAKLQWSIALVTEIMEAGLKRNGQQGKQ